jgi:hypothetical protein
MELPSTAGQRENSASAMPAARAARAGCGANFVPGSGTKASAPATRASTSAKLYSMETETVALTGIPPQVA